jgi:hypothetical protein
LNEEVFCSLCNDAAKMIVAKKAILQETSKSTSKTIAKQAEQQRRRELEMVSTVWRTRATEISAPYATGLSNILKATPSEIETRVLLSTPLSIYWNILGGQMLVALDGTAVRS